MRQQGCTRDESLTPICRILRLDITDLAFLRKWPSLSTRNKDRKAKLRPFFTSGNRKN